jgi:poly-beta-1,6-N-acetyl-D-glucosamine synthase
MNLSPNFGKYLVISPCRNEAKFMRQTLDSVVAQSILPSKWVIVDDGSTDETPNILKEYAARYPWIEIVTRKDRGTRSVGPGVIEAFYAGYEAVDSSPYTYLCKLDLDLVLPRRYFEILIQRMLENPLLATISGKAYLDREGQLVNEGHGDENSIGASKFYRMDRFQEMGGFISQVMWDGIDGHICRMRGWQAQSVDDPELRFIHLRPMGSSQKSILTGRIRHGKGQYFMGSGLLWMLATAVYRIPERPVFVGGLFILWGWLKSWIAREPRFEKEGFREFLHSYQRKALVIGKKNAISGMTRRQQG